MWIAGPRQRLYRISVNLTHETHLLHPVVFASLFDAYDIHMLSPGCGGMPQIAQSGMLGPRDVVDEAIGMNSVRLLK